METRIVPVVVYPAKIARGLTRRTAPNVYRAATLLRRAVEKAEAEAAK